MKTALIGLAFGAALMAAGCATDRQAAYWTTACATGNLQTVGTVTNAQVTRCAADERVFTGTIITRPGKVFGPAKPENTFYVGNGMAWFNPKAEDYAALTAGLVPVVFPYRSLKECQSAGKCAAPTEV